MQPLPLLDEDNLLIADLKVKSDDHKNREINLGLVYRHYYREKVIVGIYNYFDHKITNNNLHISGWTAGAELLSEYIDGRVNYYLPENKKKKIDHNHSKIVRLSGTSVSATAGGHRYERGLKGYDIELGGALFGISEKMNEKLGTRLLVSHYEFYNKNTRTIRGNRVRIEQKLGRMQLGSGGLHFTFNAALQRDMGGGRGNSGNDGNNRKPEWSIGIGAKFVLGEKVVKSAASNTNLNTTSNTTNLRSRMMETTVRDIDIVTQGAQDPDRVSNLFLGNRKIERMIHVGAAGDGYIGDGTKEKPLSLGQLKDEDTDNAIIILTNIGESEGGREITREEYDRMGALPNVVNGKGELNLTSSDAHNISIRDMEGIHIVNYDPKNTKIIVNNEVMAAGGNGSAGLVNVRNRSDGGSGGNSGGNNTGSNGSDNNGSGEVGSVNSSNSANNSNSSSSSFESVVTLIGAGDQLRLGGRSRATEQVQTQSQAQNQSQAQAQNQIIQVVPIEVQVQVQAPMEIQPQLVPEAQVQVVPIEVQVPIEAEVGLQQQPHVQLQPQPQPQPQPQLQQPELRPELEAPIEVEQRIVHQPQQPIEVHQPVTVHEDVHLEAGVQDVAARDESVENVITQRINVENNTPQNRILNNRVIVDNRAEPEMELQNLVGVREQQIPNIRENEINPRFINQPIEPTPERTDVNHHNENDRPIDIEDFHDVFDDPDIQAQPNIVTPSPSILRRIIDGTLDLF
jgi:hypothetical protein